MNGDTDETTQAARTGSGPNTNDGKVPVVIDGRTYRVIRATAEALGQGER